VTKILPILLIAATTLVTTAIIQAVYGFLYLWQSAFGSTVPSYDWSESLSASAIATAVVLLAGAIAQRLFADKPVTPGSANAPVAHMPH
jgi:TRAP-type C4-dicarboxylate transport system permease small subunit